MSVACLRFPAGLPKAGLRALGEACLRFSSQVALRGEEAVFVETGGSRLLYGEARLRAGLGALGRRFAGAAPARFGWGAHAGEALALARHGAEGTPRERWPLEALHAYASPFTPDEAVARAVDALCAGLRGLGLTDLGGFLALPERGWGGRFGADAALLRERLGGRLLMGWPRFEPDPRLEECAEFLEESEGAADPDPAAFVFLLQSLCSRLSARLRGRALRASGLRLRIGLERVRGVPDAADRVLGVELAVPVAEPTGLRRILGERLAADLAARPLGRRPVRLTVEATSTVPGFHPQRDAFDRREEEVESRDTLLARLAQRLGDDAVFYARIRARHGAEWTWTRRAPPATPAEEADLGRASLAARGAVPAVPRPTRLTRLPLPLLRAGDWLLYFGGSGKGRRWRALDWEGPERVDGLWWMASGAGAEGAPPVDRDYWRVRTEGGMDLWVFCRQGEEARAGALWLRGWWS